MTTLKIASGFRRVILACALPATVLLATPAFPTEPTPEQRYPNHERDIAWIPATSDFHRGRDFAGVPGVVVAHAPKGTGICLGSPSLVVLPNGTYVASHDLFGKKWAERDGTSMLIYQSKDKGKTWACVSRVNNQNWSTLFWHQGALYIMGCGFPENGFVVRKSTDNGRTWTEPKDGRSGLISKERMLTNVMPIAVGNGRIYVSAEQGYEKPKGWCHQYSFVMSSPAESNLLDAANWTKSTRVLIPPEMANLAHVGWLEGNMVQRKSDGKVFNILRTHGITDEVAAFYEITSDGKTAQLNAYDMFIRMPGAAKKYYIVPDDRSDTYYALSNWILEKDRGKVSNCPHPIKAERTRNTLALARSDNLVDWQVMSVILHDNDVDHCGFQYPSAAIEGDDLLILSRTAFGKGDESAANQHDSNFITFHRVRDFRNRTLKTEPLTGAIE